MKSAFSEVLGRLRRERGLSQRRVATDLGITQALLSHYENDAREPRFDFLVKVCDYYEVSADYMLGRSDSRGDDATILVKSVCDILHALEELNHAEADLIANLKKTTDVRT